MAHPEQLELIRRGVKAWNQWRGKNPEKRPDLNGVDLNEAHLYGVDLNEAHLSRANLGGADLSGAHLREANISGVNLYGTARDEWKIDGIRCTHVFWDITRKRRTPKDRNFTPGEFEARHTSLPTFEYLFEQGV